MRVAAIGWDWIIAMRFCANWSTVCVCIFWLQKRRERVCLAMHIDIPQTSYSEILQRLVRRYLFKLERMKEESKHRLHLTSVTCRQGWFVFMWLVRVVWGCLVWLFYLAERRLKRDKTESDQRQQHILWNGLSCRNLTGFDLVGFGLDIGRLICRRKLFRIIRSGIWFVWDK